MPSFLKDLLWRLRGYYSVRGLIKKGLKIGTGCKIMERVIIDVSHAAQIEIGNNVTLAPGVYVLAHDTSIYQTLGYTYIAKVKIEDGVFIGANSIVLPGVTIGRNSIIGAGSVVSKDVPTDVVAVGNPAKVIGMREEFLEKHRAQMKTAPLFGEEYTLRQHVSSAMQQEMNGKMKNGYGYIK